MAALTKELAEAKEAYEVEAEAHHDSHERLLREQDHSSSLEARLAEQQGRHEAEIEKQVAARTHSLQERLNGANREVMDLRGQLEDANAKISASETRLHESMAQLNVRLACGHAPRACCRVARCRWLPRVWVSRVGCFAFAGHGPVRGAAKRAGVASGHRSPS